MIKAVGHWLFDRLGLGPADEFLEGHTVPPALGTKLGWMYVFGFATLFAFLVQALTGVTLATMYVPSPLSAHESLQYITHQATLGGFLRGLHYFGASAMVVLICVHAFRVFLTGSYKFPREMNWITGVLLLFLTMAMALTGQLLRWDEDGLWTVVVAATFASRLPFIGAQAGEFILGGPSVGAPTLTRFYALHVLVLPAAIALLVAAHMWLLICHGISEPPRSGRPVNVATYRGWYARLKERHGIPYWPYSVAKELTVATAMLVVIVVLAAVFGPKGPGPAPDPTIVAADPRPDWYLRWYYALLWIKPRGLESFVMIYLPLIALAGLMLMPIVFRDGERSLRRRPWAVGLVALVVVFFSTLTAIGLRVPWSPEDEEPPLTAVELGVASGPVFDGATVFHERACQTCHRALGRGGRYGPDLTHVLLRISPQEVTVRTIQGFGDMPAYRSTLSDDEMEALLALFRALPSRAAALGM